MEGAAGSFGVPYYEWLKPRSSSPPLPSSSSSTSSTLSTPSIDHSAVIDDQERDAMTCLPLLGRLEGRATTPDRGPNPVKLEELVTSDITGTTGARGEAAAGVVDLNIGLPAIGGYSSEEAPMGEEDEDEEEDYEGEEEEEKPRKHDKCKEEEAGHHHANSTEMAVESVEGAEPDYLRVDGEDGVRGFMDSRGRRFWIPTPAQILVGPVQFICQVCSKTFNRYNNMQVIHRSLSHLTGL